MAKVQPPPLTALADAPLRPLGGVKGDTVNAKELWKSSPSVVLVLRRPGCSAYLCCCEKHDVHHPGLFHALKLFGDCAVLCRAEAQKVYALKPQLDAMHVQLNCVVHENIEEEINAFHPAYWCGLRRFFSAFCSMRCCIADCTLC